MPIAVEDNPFVYMNLAAQDPVLDPAQVEEELTKAAFEKDQAPSARTATNTTPQLGLDRLTTRFDVTRIPLSRLRQMRRDPMIAFALFFIHAQLARARWCVESEDAQVAAFIDNALRNIYAGLVANFVEKLAYGFKPVIKRFGQELPDWTYADEDTGEEKKVWDEGNIMATVWKPFVGLPVETAEPLWTPDGDFDGIKYNPASLLATRIGITDREVKEFDVLHSLWFTNEKETVDESLWGFPRIGYAYRFWWSFWFDWGLADRHFEKDADPPTVVRYPKTMGPTVPDPVTGATTTNVQRALAIGDKARSNSTIALPSDVIDTGDTSARNQYEWDVSFLTGGGNFGAFKDRFDQLQTYILRSMMIPPEAFDAKGGTAGYNSTGQLQEAFTTSQVTLMDELDTYINRFVIPQLVMANFSDRQVTVKKVTKGFNTIDTQLATALLQALASSDPSQLAIDVAELMRETGIPRLTAAEIAKAQEEKAKLAAQFKPEPMAPVNGNAGVNDQGKYFNGRPQIRIQDQTPKAPGGLEESVTLLSELSKVASLRDEMIMQDAVRLQNVWQQNIAIDFSDAAMLLQQYDGTKVDLDESFFERWTRRAKDRAQQTVSQTFRVLASIMRRASTVELDRAGLKDFSWDPSQDDKATAFLAERAADLVQGISNTTRDEIRTYLADLQRRGVDPEHMPALVQAHFDLFSEWRADRLVRSEINRAYNYATLLAAKDAGVKKVKALDAQLGEKVSDPICIKRNQQQFSIDDAFKEEMHHPNCTLEWRIIK